MTTDDIATDPDVQRHATHGGAVPYCEPVYREEFQISEDWDLTDEGERGFIGFRCNACDRDVTDQPCPGHAPRDVPGLRRADCWATPAHPPVWEVDRDDYGLPCPHCQYASLRAELDWHEHHCRHWPWRRWRLTSRLCRWLRAVRVTPPYGWHYSAEHRGCLTFTRSARWYQRRAAWTAARYPELSHPADGEEAQR